MVSFLKKRELIDFFLLEGGTRDDRRLLSSAIPVFLIFSLVTAQIYITRFSQFLPAPWEKRDTSQILIQTPEEKIYPVLVEQKERPKPLTDQMRALSDVTAEGTGGITENRGFHTLSDSDTMSLSGGQAGRPSASRTKNENRAGDIPREDSIGGGGNPSAQAGSEDRYRIPTNYRFKNDFALRYDGSSRLSIAREELQGYHYFRNMLRQIQEAFAPPGFNLAYRDQAGTVLSQPIKPGVVQVLFMLDTAGSVRDVRVVSSLGQTPVDQACKNALIGQYFGPPPPEVLAKGNIFGINFIFPSVF